MNALRRVAGILLAFLIVGFHSNLISGEKIENYWGWTGDSNSYGISQATLQYDSQNAAVNIINRTSTASRPVLSINNEFVRPELIGGIPIGGYKASCGQWLDCTQRKTSEGYSRSIVRPDWVENEGVYLHRNVSDW
jgi:hypothetical protein